MDRTILVVEDDPHILQMVQVLLESSGFSPLIARSGQKALDILERQQVDLIVLDILMPGMNGWDVLRALQNDERHSHIPVIMLTAKQHSVDEMLALQVFGVRAYITKPFQIEELLEQVGSILGQSGTLET
jgi:two-component system, OmpR family, alkaline phosphatase synthesis response regulator PhoP